MTCISCYNNYYLYNRTCVLNCPVSTYADIYNKTCLSCAVGCLNCSKLSNCFKCNIGYTLNTTTGVCNNTVCTGGSNCSICSPDSKCLLCNDGFYLYNNMCLSICPSATFAAPSICYDCPLSCLTCINRIVCTNCKNGYNLYG